MDRWSEYAGGYSDMLAQRGGDVARQPPRARNCVAPRQTSAPVAEPAATAPAAKPGKRRLSFHESTRSRTCRGASPAWRRASATCAGVSRSDPVRRGDRKVFAEVSASLAAAQSELAAARRSGSTSPSCATTSKAYVRRGHAHAGAPAT